MATDRPAGTRSMRCDEKGGSREELNAKNFIPYVSKFMLLFKTPLISTGWQSEAAAAASVIEEFAGQEKITVDPPQ